MNESILEYFRIIPFAVKRKKVLEFINLKLQKDTDRWRNKRRREYEEKSISPKDALKKIISDVKIEDKTFSELENHLNRFIEIQSNKKYPSTENPYPVNFGLDTMICRFLFSICVKNKPEIVIETGVANGFSSSYFLLAMNQNQKGKLISIDDIVRPWQTKEKIGRAIPDQLKYRHTLIVGDSKIELKKLVKNLDEIDIMMHDSSHTYQHMMNEFKIVWPHIKKNGLLLSDDVSQNDAFLDFADMINHEPIIVSKVDKEHFGIIKKT